MDKKYFIVTFGCQMNVHESEKLSGMLEDLGYSLTAEIEKADIIVFNTCAIREGAETKALGHIGACKPLKKLNPNLIVAVGGCMTQQQKRADEVYKKFPFVNIIFGTHNLYELKDYIVEYNKTHKRISNVWGKDKDNVLPIEAKSVRTSGYNAWVNISYGCNNFCTYCIVPHVRGRERSRPFLDIVEECKTLIGQGYKFITLLGQNVNSYGNDIKDDTCTFANLLKTIAELDGDFELCYMTSHPRDFNSEVIDVIASHPKISTSIHLPVQSGSDNMLTSMNRHYTISHYMDLVNEIYAKIPNATISTDIIVGFAGETEEDYQQTIELVKKVRYSTIFSFMYSIRKGTPAEKFPNQIPAEIKHKRVNELLALEKQIMQEDSEKLIGKTLRAFVYEQSKNKIFAKLDCNKTVVVENTDNFTPRFIKVKITKYSKGQLYGEEQK